MGFNSNTTQQIVPSGVAGFLRERKETILRSWLERASLTPQDSAPQLLDALAGWLEEEGESRTHALLTKGASDRVRQRLGAGVSLAQLLCEHRLLRETIIEEVLRAETVEQKRAGSSGEDGRIARIEELARLNVGLDVVFSRSIEQFVEERDQRAAAERAAAAEALRVSETRYRTLFESIDEGFCLVQLLYNGVLDPIDYRFLEVNSAFERHTGLTNVTGKCVREVIPELEQHWFVTYGQVARTGLPQRVQNVAQALDRFYDVYAFRFGAPELRQVAILFNDITDRKRAEDSLRASDRWKTFLIKLGDALRSLADPIEIQNAAMRVLGEYLDASGAQYFEVDPTGEYVESSGGYSSTGLPMTERLKLDDFGKFIIEDYRAGRSLVIDDTHTDERIDEETRQAWDQVAIRATVGVPLFKDRKLVAVLGIKDFRPRAWTADDITCIEETIERTWAAVERARAEETLRQNEERQQFLLTLSDGLRPLSDMDVVHAIVTRSVRNYFDVDRCYYSEIVDNVAIVRQDARRPDLPSVAGAYPLNEYPNFKAMLDAGRPLVIEDARTSENLDENLRRLCVQMQTLAFVSVPVIKNGAPLGSLAITHRTPRKWTDFEVTLAAEVTERTWAAIEHAQTLVALREANERLREADRHKNEFLGVLSHELRNPLAPIRNSIYLLERAAPGTADAVQARLVIDRQTQHMTRLIDDLLDVTRISRGKIVLHRECIDVNAITRRTAEDHRQMFSSAGIKLEVMDVGRPVWIQGDHTRIIQIVGNLLTNSLKFTQRGGETTLTLRESADHAVIHVRDNGTGMSQKTLAHLFEPFMQATQTIERSEGGLGLGLALVKGLVDLHAGTITVHSDGEGQGSEFVISLPLQNATSAAATLSGPAIRAKVRSVLVVEDQVDTAETLRRILSLNGHQVGVAYTGPDGLEAARTNKPDIILCDIGLPGISGYQIARSIRADADTMLQRTYMVAISGYASPEDVAKAKEAGFNHHMAKPPNFRLLEKLIDEAAPLSDPLEVR